MVPIRVVSCSIQKGVLMGGLLPEKGVKSGLFRVFDRIVRNGTVTLSVLGVAQYPRFIFGQQAIDLRL
jgi:hypothetical protein